MSDDNGRHVTNKELNERLEKLPTRWEVRFLILAGLFGSQLIPARDVAQAAVNLFH